MTEIEGDKKGERKGKTDKFVVRNLRKGEGGKDREID
jgi:hypothetical protein